MNSKNLSKNKFVLGRVSGQCWVEKPTGLAIAGYAGMLGYFKIIFCEKKYMNLIVSMEAGL